MSLILDALKKSEAERQRGQPPTLYAHFSAPRRVRRTPWVAGAGAVLLAAGLAGSSYWLVRGRGGDDGEGAANAVAGLGTAAVDESTRGGATMAPMDPVAPESTATVAMEPVKTASESGAADSRVVHEAAFGGVAGAGNSGTVSGGGLPVPERAMLYTPSATPGPGTAATKPAPVDPTLPETVVPAEVAPPVAAAPTPVATLPEPPAALPQPIEPPPALVDHGPSGPSAPEVAVSKPEEVLPQIFQLPYATRKDMPKLELSMHVFSPDPTERFIVLNGKRFTLDAAAPGPDLTLLDIVADGAVFEYRGQRFLLPRQAY